MLDKDLEKILGLSGRYILLTIPLPKNKRKTIWIRVPARPLDKRVAKECIAVYAHRKDAEPYSVIPIGKAFWVLSHWGKWRKVAFRAAGGQVDGYVRKESLDVNCRK